MVAARGAAGVGSWETGATTGSGDVETLCFHL